MSELTPNTIILFGVNGRWNLNGSEELIEETRRISYLLANGKIEYRRLVKGRYRTYSIDEENDIDINWNKPPISGENTNSTPE